MTFIKSAAIAVSLIFFAGPINADAGNFYLGASVGNATLDEDFDGLNVDDNSTTLRIIAGWNINDYFSLEAGYQNFGDFEQTFPDVIGLSVANISADGFILGATGRIPLSERFALTGRAGAFFWNGSAQINNVSQATPEDSNPYLGVGVSFDVGKRVQLTGDLTRYELDNAASNAVSIGFRYQFD